MIGEGIGDVKLGMPLDKIRKLFDDLEENTKTLYRYPYEVTYVKRDCFM